MKNKSKRTHIRLGVNIDHIATLRQVRGGTTVYPDLVRAVQLCKKAGADQITIHLREDRRHIQLKDLIELTKKSPLPLNLEMGMTEEMVELAKKYKPEWVCLVPEKREELTTEGGLDVARLFGQAESTIQQLVSKKIKISLFIEPHFDQVVAASKLGADAVEFHTGHWVLLKGAKKQVEWKRLCEAANLAHSFGIRVHAGHGLDPVHCKKIRDLPFLQEVNIGHYLICESVFTGLIPAIKNLNKILA